MKFAIDIFRRFAFISSVVLWLGGFTFYAGVVVPVGARALHSHMRQGLVTQQVSFWLNLIGIPALLFILWNAVAIPRAFRWLRRSILLTWGGMALIQPALFVLHPIMDRLVDIPHAQVLDFDRFDRLHFAYGLLSTAQWGLGVLHVLLVLVAWAQAPAQASPPAALSCAGEQLAIASD